MCKPECDKKRNRRAKCWRIHAFDNPWQNQRTYFAKNVVEEDFKFLKDKLQIPVPPFYMRKDGRIRVDESNSGKIVFSFGAE